MAISLETQVLLAIKSEGFEDEVVNNLVKNGPAELDIVLVKERLEALKTGSADGKPVAPRDVVSASKAFTRIERCERNKELMNPRPSVAERIESDRERGSITRETFGL